jgi:hypothetical protein
MGDGEFLNVTAGGIYSYHWALKGQVGGGLETTCFASPRDRTDMWCDPINIPHIK